jgi:D-alanyl-D-alanine carboxypeptidase
MALTELQQKQCEFSYMLARLIAWAHGAGFLVSIGEVHRSLHDAERNAQSGAGIVNSLHTIDLAADLRLYVGGEYQTESDAYSPLGIYWEELGGSWGGRFSNPDGNHFSLSHHGIR